MRWLTIPSFPRRRLIAFKSTLYLLSISGVFYLPYDRSVAGLVLYNFYFVTTTSSLMTVTVLTGLDLFGDPDDVEVLADRGVIFAALIVMLTKQNALLVNTRRIETWLADIQRRYSTADAAETLRFDRNDQATFYYVKMLACLWLLISGSFLLPLYLGNPEEFDLPSMNADLFDVDSVLKYAVIYAWNTVALSLATSRGFGTDLFMVAMYTQASSRLEALGDVLEKIGHGNDEYDENGSISAVRRLVRKSVSEHNDIVKFIGELNHVYYWPLLVHYVFVASIVAGCGFFAFVSILHGNISSFVKSAMYITGVMCQNWVYCKFGDRLKSASLNISKALWKSDWYKLSANDRLSVLLMMRASGKPFRMGAGYFFQMDRESLRFILSSAYSYFTLLRNIYS